MRIENFIKKTRLEKGITLRELAKMTMISKSKLNRIETEGGNIGTLEVCLIAKALDMDKEDLYKITE